VTYYLRRFNASGYQWWNGTSFTTAQAGATGGNEVAVTSATTQVTFGAGLWATGAWSWSVQTTGASGTTNPSGYSPAWVINVVAQPTTPTLTATYDSTNNRVSLVVAGTGTDKAWFEYSDDNVTWYNVRGATAVAQVSGAATVYDWDPPAQTPLTRNYRVLQWDSTAAVANNYSNWGTATAAWPVPPKFGLRDPLAMTVGINPHVLQGTLDTSFGQNMTEHTGLGDPQTTPVFDVIGLEDGGATFCTYSVSDDAAFMALVLSNRVLSLQTTDGRAWFVRFNVPRPITTPYLVAPGSYRNYALTWRGQRRPVA
jgi:hypothetical protein